MPTLYPRWVNNCQSREVVYVHDAILHTGDGFTVDEIQTKTGGLTAAGINDLLTNSTFIADLFANNQFTASLSQSAGL